MNRKIKNPERNVPWGLGSFTYRHHRTYSAYHSHDEHRDLQLRFWRKLKSTESYRSAPSRKACSAASATLLNKQKPQALSASAWCPGGRTNANPLEFWKILQGKKELDTMPETMDVVNVRQQLSAWQAAWTLSYISFSLSSEEWAYWSYKNRVKRISKSIQFRLCVSFHVL